MKKNFESFSEDSALTNFLAAAYINGVQSERIAASPKHVALTKSRRTGPGTFPSLLISFKIVFLLLIDGDTSVDTLVTLSTLREIYLKAFQAMLQNSDPLRLMTS
jgi:beta-glucosidase